MLLVNAHAHGSTRRPHAPVFACSDDIVPMAVGSIVLNTAGQYTPHTCVSTALYCTARHPGMLCTRRTTQVVFGEERRLQWRQQFIMSSLQHHNNAMLPYRCFPLHLLQLLDEVLPRISRLVVQQTGAEFCKYLADVFVAQVRLCGRPGLHHRHHTDPHAPIRQIGINERPEGVRPNEMYDVVRASVLTLGGASATTDCDDGSLFATSPHNTTTAAGYHPRPRYSHAESFSRTSP